MLGFAGLDAAVGVAGGDGAVGFDEQEPLAAELVEDGLWHFGEDVADTFGKAGTVLDEERAVSA